MNYFLPLTLIENPTFTILVIVFSITLCILNLIIYSKHYNLNFKSIKKLWAGGIRFAILYNEDIFYVQ